MNYILNFDIFFIIAFIGLTVSAIFKKTYRYSKNFWLFFFSTLIIGLLVYFKVDVQLFTSLQNTLAPIMAKLPQNIMQERFLGLWYFIILLIVDGLLWLVLKIISFIFVRERSKFKKDVTYTSSHHGFTNFITSIFQFSLLTIFTLIVLNYANLKFGFVTDNSYLIKFFNETFKPVLELLQSRGCEFFGLFGF